MIRGDIVIVAAGGGFGGKPRPALVLQWDELGAVGTVLVALITTTQTEVGIVRPPIGPGAGTGLSTQSWLMADKIVPVRRDKVGAVIGRLSVGDMARAERAVLTALGFSR